MLQWLPTTGEFGLYGTFGDFDHHERVATRLGAHYTLYYYSFTDAFIAMAYRSLTPAEQARVDPADMYAADHVRRVLRRTAASAGPPSL